MCSQTMFSHQMQILYARLTFYPYTTKHAWCMFHPLKAGPHAPEFVHSRLVQLWRNQSFRFCGEKAASCVLCDQ